MDTLLPVAQNKQSAAGHGNYWHDGGAVIKRSASATAHHLGLQRLWANSQLQLVTSAEVKRAQAKEPKSRAYTANDSRPRSKGGGVGV